MREYGQIQTAYWTHPDTQDLSIDAKLIGAYLLTCQHSNGIGCFRMPFGYVSIDLGMGIDRVSEGFAELFRKGFIEHDKLCEYVLINHFLRWNPVSNPNSAKARAKEFDLIPMSVSVFPSLINALMQYGKYWSDDFRSRIETLSKPYRNPIETVPEDLPDNKTRPEPNQTLKGGAAAPVNRKDLKDLNYEAWETYISYRREAKLRKLQSTSEQKQQQWLITQGDEKTQAAIVDQTIRNTWQGLFKLKSEGNGSGKPSDLKTADDVARAYQAEFGKPPPVGKSTDDVRRLLKQRREKNESWLT